ncbi:MAG: hypothetical protein CMI26_10685 [Opitutae bacterium]|nr:hypothetical protein [Opitutae bacterium]
MQSLLRLLGTQQVHRLSTALFSLQMSLRRGGVQQAQKLEGVQTIQFLASRFPLGSCRHLGCERRAEPVFFITMQMIAKSLFYSQKTNRLGRCVGTPNGWSVCLLIR